MVALEVDDLGSREPHFKDDVELAVDSFQPTTAGRFELVINVRRNLNLPEPPEILFQEHELELVDGDGTPLRQAGPDQHPGRPWGHVQSHVRRRERQRRTQEAAVRLSAAAQRQRDLAIVFHHVPLPTGRPE